MDQGATPYSYITTLTGGTLYDIELHYYEHAGDAACRLHWSYLGQSTQPIPQSQLYPAAGQQQVAAPTFNPAPGTYSSAQSVAITSAEAGAFIRYTTDGSTPTSSTGTLYSGPVPVSSTTTLKAIAFKTGMADSSVTSGTYAINIVPTYTLTVTGGTGSGVYAADTLVNVNATVPSGQQFAGWTGATHILTSQAPSTTARMPPSNASLTATFSAIGGPGTGLRARDYNDNASTYPLASPFTGSPVLTRTDATVDFYWGTGSPGSPVTSNFFSAKWVGKLKAPVATSYTFKVTGDDGVRLFLNGVKVIDGWMDQGATSYSYITTLTGGTLYDIELHYYEHASDAACRLQWSYPGQTEQAIPQSALRTTGAITREVWTGITGDSVANIPTGSAPTFTDTLTSFEAPSNWSNNYGTRVRGYITAPATGSYRFWIASDNTSELWLSTSSNPTNKQRIARVTGRTNPRQWTKESNQRSAAISLVQNQIYYVEALHKEGTANDNLAVGWSKPGQSTSAPSEIIPGTVLSPFQ